MPRKGLFGAWGLLILVFSSGVRPRPNQATVSFDLNFRVTSAGIWNGLGAANRTALHAALLQDLLEHLPPLNQTRPQHRLSKEAVGNTRLNTHVDLATDYPGASQIRSSIRGLMSLDTPPTMRRAKGVWGALVKQSNPIFLLLPRLAAPTFEPHCQSTQGLSCVARQGQGGSCFPARLDPITPGFNFTGSCPCWGATVKCSAHQTCMGSSLLRACVAANARGGGCRGTTNCSDEFRKSWSGGQVNTTGKIEQYTVSGRINMTHSSNQTVNTTVGETLRQPLKADIATLLGSLSPYVSIVVGEVAPTRAGGFDVGYSLVAATIYQALAVSSKLKNLRTIPGRQFNRTASSLASSNSSSVAVGGYFGASPAAPRHICSNMYLDLCVSANTTLPQHGESCLLFTKGDARGMYVYQRVVGSKAGTCNCWKARIKCAEEEGCYTGSLQAECEEHRALRMAAGGEQAECWKDWQCQVNQTSTPEPTPSASRAPTHTPKPTPTYPRQATLSPTPTPTPTPTSIPTATPYATITDRWMAGPRVGVVVVPGSPRTPRESPTPQAPMDWIVNPEAVGEQPEVSGFRNVGLLLGLAMAVVVALALLFLPGVLRDRLMKGEGEVDTSSWPAPSIGPMGNDSRLIGPVGDGGEMDGYVYSDHDYDYSNNTNWDGTSGYSPESSPATAQTTLSPLNPR